jgi:hypothetical protein
VSLHAGGPIAAGVGALVSLGGPRGDGGIGGGLGSDNSGNGPA